MTVKKSTEEKVKNITDKWTTTGSMRESLCDQLQLILDGKADPEVSKVLLKESTKVNKELRKRLREMGE